ncbi:MAG: hypothetical protein RMK60_11380, partial [Burkholderiales bacterium]|nr:hypothetical protein [Burkholderiales bacterium]
KDWEQIAKLLAGQSDRWVHHILAERETLCTLPFAAVWQRIRHHLLHGEEGERRARNIDTLFDQVRTAWESWAGNRTKDQISDDQRIMHFITWCQHAAWCSRFMPRTASTAAREASS